MTNFVRLVLLGALIVGVTGCGGNERPPDEQFEMAPAEVRAADAVRNELALIEPGTPPEQVGQMLVENLEGMMQDPAVQANKETYQKILDAAKALAAGDQSKLQEIRQLAETLPKE